LCDDATTVGKELRMNDWMMAGVWRYILRLPPGIGTKRVEQLAARARAEVGALSVKQRAVHHFVVRELPRHGRAMAPATIAESLDLATDEVAAILADLEAKKGFLFRNDHGSVVWAYPVTADATPHHIRFKSGETLYAA
jgi:hypothetical protein